jgi:hypothetical protein
VEFFWEHHRNAKEDVPTQQSASGKNAWLSRTDENERWPIGFESSA